MSQDNLLIAPKQWLTDLISDKTRWRFHLALLIPAVLCIFWVYFGTLSFPFVNWDDPDYVVRNPVVRSFSFENVIDMFRKPYVGIYAPLTMLSFALDYQIFHFDAGGYHLTNLLLHVANCVLVYLIIWHITRDWLMALSVTLIFGVHPVQVESVVWISQRKNLLFGFWFLWALLLHIRARAKTSYSSGSGFAVFGLYGLACFSKSSAVVLPAVLLCYDYAFGHLKKRDWRLYLPLFGVALVFSILATVNLKSIGLLSFHGGSFLSNLYAMTVASVRYLQLLFAPMNLTVWYHFPIYATWKDPQVLISGFILLTIAALYILSWKIHKPVFFWFSWSLIILLPMLNIIPQEALIQDRWLYLAVIGVYVPLLTVLRRFTGGDMVIMVCILLTSAYAFLNIKQQKVWSDSEYLWVNAARYAPPENVLPLHNLGIVYLNKGLYEQAEKLFEKAAAVREDAYIFSGLGEARMLLGKGDEAVETYQRGIAKFPENWTLRASLGQTYHRLGKHELAIRSLAEAVEGDPDNLFARKTLGYVYGELGRMAEAEAEFLEALRIDSGDPDALHDLIVTYKEMGNPEKAAGAFETFQKLHPRDGRVQHLRNFLQEA
ncbi:MAG: tetratricopeptide repeat protein [Candidatus Omnitrophota bacterium]|nr:tetratricopeptide repeat protein [Candidatus Omnitrophota bacterium]